MTTLISVLVLAMVLPMLSTIICYYIKDGTKNESRVAKFLSHSEMEEVKKYATAFGISNDMSDADAQKLLELGRKLSAHIGDEKFIEFLDVIIAQEACFEQHIESRGIHHVINMIIEASDLVAHIAPSFITTNKTFGGDRDGEPSIGTYTAA